VLRRGASAGGYGSKEEGGDIREWAVERGKKRDDRKRE
jgi:hypothetical protein